MAALPVTEHEAVPEQPPVHPSNFEPEAAVAARVTSAPAEYISEQSLPQLMPVGLLATVPEPLPDFVMVML